LIAAHWHQRAADRIGSDDVQQTAHHARSVITLLREHESEEGAAHLLGLACARLLNLGWRIGLEREAVEIHEDGRRWARAATDVATEGEICGAFAAVHAVAGRLMEADRIGVDFVQLAERSGDPETEVVARAWMAYPKFRMGRLEEEEPKVVEIVEAGERDPRLGIRFIGSSIAGLAFSWLIDIQGRTRSYRELRATIDRGLRVARSRRESESECLQLVAGASAVLVAGDVERATMLAGQAVTIADELDSPLVQCASRRVMGLVLARSGDATEAATLARAGLEIARELHINLEQEAEYLIAFSDAHRALGDLDGALDWARQAVSSVERTGARMYHCEALDCLARALLARGEGSEVVSVLEHMETSARHIRAPNLIPFVAWRRAELAALGGDAAEHKRLLREAHAAFVEREAEGHATTLAAQLEALDITR